MTGEWVDEDVRDPLGSIFVFLTEKKDRALAQAWGGWMCKYDSEQAMKV